MDNNYYKELKKHSDLLEKRRSKRHFKERGGDAKTKALRRFVEKTWKGHDKAGTYSSEDVRRRAGITSKVVKAAEKRGVNTNYIY